MTIIPAGAVQGATPPSPAAGRQSDAGSGFAVPAGTARATGGQAALAPPHEAPGGGGTGAMLALQELAAEQGAGPSSERSADVADREARRRGRDMLAALAALQKALLDGGDPEPGLAGLARLVDAAPPACDPILAGIVSAIRLRARLEILRRSPAHAPVVPSGAPAQAVEP